MTTAPPVPVGGPIWPADWSQFFPDLITGAVVAAAVGFALWRWQRNAESSQARRLALASWSVPRMRALLIVREPAGQGPADDPTTDTPIARLCALASELPVVAWADAVPNSVELSSLRELVRTYAAFEDAGTALVRTIDAEVFARAYRMTPGDREVVRKTALRRLAADEDSSDDIVLRMLGVVSGLESFAAQITKYADEVISSEGVVEARGTYLQTYETVLSHYEAFRTAVSAHS